MRGMLLVGAVVGVFGLGCGDDGRPGGDGAWGLSEGETESGTTGGGGPMGGTDDPSLGTTGAEGGDDDGSTGAMVPDVPAVDDCPRVRVVVPPSEPLNLRPDPSTANPALASLPNGTLLEVLGEVQGEVIEGNDVWFHVLHGEVEGYVSAVFAECTTDEPPELTDPDGFYVPLPCGMSSTITQGNNGDLTHNGLHAYAFDFSIGLGTSVVAMADGVVTLIYADTQPGDPCYNGGGSECGPYGNLVILLHGDGSTSLYKHLSEVHVAPGDFVPRGSPVGLSGTTGYSTGRHLHAMRMENCGQFKCQSIPTDFADAGVPVTGQVVTSQNCP